MIGAIKMIEPSIKNSPLKQNQLLTKIKNKIKENTPI
jgi:hypothetical protein